MRVALETIHGKERIAKFVLPSYNGNWKKGKKEK